MATFKPPSKNRLLEGFSKSNVDAIWKTMEREYWDSGNLYSNIKKAVWALREPGAEELARDLKWRRPPVNRRMNKDEDLEQSCDPLVRDLVEILGFKKKGATRRVDLFADAIRAMKNLADDPEAGEQPVSKLIAYITVQALCKIDPESAFHAEKEEKASAFHEAAQSGTDLLMRIMITELENLLEEKDPRTSKDRALKYMSKKYESRTACFMAVDGLKLEVLKTLATDYPSLVDESCVKTAIEKFPQLGAHSQETALEAFKLMWEARDPHNSVKFWKEAVTARSLPVVRYLMTEAYADMFATYSNAIFLIENGNREMWKMLSKPSRDKLMEEPNCQLLHTAVSKRQAGIVDEILSEYPDQIGGPIGLNNYSKHPLQHLRDQGQPFDDDIRNRLVHAMIKSPKLEIRDIRGILKRSNVEAQPMTLSFPKIYTPEETFAGYVEWLTEQSGPESIYKFESILKHVRFPDLTNEPPPQTPQDWRKTPTEIRKVMDWLRDRRVTTVLSLSVFDRLHQPHSDEDVAACVNGLGVRVLKWRKLDLYLGNLNAKDKEQRAQLQELHLFSSGKRAVHDDWYKELPKFPNLTRLHVSVVEDILSEDRAKEVQIDLQKRLDEINKNQLKKQWISTSSKESDEASANDQASVDVPICKWALDQEEEMPTDTSDNTFEVVGPNFDQFLKKFQNHYKTIRKTKNPQRTKVALIDSGVVVFDGGSKRVPRHGSSTYGNYLSLRVVDGTSLVSKDNEDEVFWHASEPHGTQMAKLICSIYPLCDLYVIKVAETRSSGITANNVADAIDWAREKGVDIISLSLVIYRDNEEKLANALRLARDKDIVIMASTADTGLRKSSSVSGQKNLRNELLSIAACNNNGHLLHESEQEGFNYCFLGNVRVDPVPTLKSKQRIHGSSVATAIAAGTAALALACCRISKCQIDGSAGNWRCRMVETTFDKMTNGNAKGVSWVDLERFCCNQGNEFLHGGFDLKATVDRNFVL